MPHVSAAPPRLKRKPPPHRLQPRTPPRRPHIPRLLRPILLAPAELPPTERRPPVTGLQPPAPRPAMAQPPVIPTAERREEVPPPAIRMEAPPQPPPPRQATPARPPAVLTEQPPRRTPARLGQPRPARLTPAHREQRAGLPAQGLPHTARPPIRGPLRLAAMRFEQPMAAASEPAPTARAATCMTSGAAWTFIMA